MKRNFAASWEVFNTRQFLLLIYWICFLEILVKANLYLARNAQSAPTTTNPTNPTNPNLAFAPATRPGVAGGGWYENYFAKNDSSTFDFNLNLGISITFLKSTVGLSINFLLNTDGTTSTGHHDLLDITGDGLVDLVKGLGKGGPAF